MERAFVHSAYNTLKSVGLSLSLPEVEWETYDFCLKLKLHDKHHVPLNSDGKTNAKNHLIFRLYLSFTAPDKAS